MKTLFRITIAVRELLALLLLMSVTIIGVCFVFPMIFVAIWILPANAATKVKRIIYEHD